MLKFQGKLRRWSKMRNKMRLLQLSTKKVLGLLRDWSQKLKEKGKKTKSAMILVLNW